jgi:hypothetical protein
MVQIKIKGHEFNAITVRDSYNRRAVQFRNKIIDTLKQIGLTEDDVEISDERMAIKKAPASATWFFEGFRLHYSYQTADKYVENLYVVYKVIELELLALLNEEKTFDEYIREFCEDSDVEKQRKEARGLLGLDDGEIDLDIINKKFKNLAKDCHPDMPGGDHGKFKALNNAHKILKRELM